MKLKGISSNAKSIFQFALNPARGSSILPSYFYGRTTETNQTRVNRANRIRAAIN
jgi:hypothetical protein